MSECGGFPAFKEWDAIVGAIRAGRQTIILRKGGIAEDRGGFRPRGEAFWLLPTQFHTQTEKLRAAVATFQSPVPNDPQLVQLTTWAELQHHQFIDEWTQVAALGPHHFWTESTVRERFEWGKPVGIHLLIIRAHVLDTPVSFHLTEAQAGCKSWVPLPIDPSSLPSSPAIDDCTFATLTADFALSP